MKISKRRLNSVGKFLTFLLRHKPDAANLNMDVNGWVKVEQLLSNTQKNEKPLTHSELMAIVENDEGRRFALRRGETGLEIRCSQGHSASLGLNLGYIPAKPPALLYHGYPEDIEDVLLTDGLKGMARQHVHLTICKSKAISAGKRYGSPKIMIINAVEAEEAGYRFYHADNGVWLADYIPPTYITPYFA